MSSHTKKPTMTAKEAATKSAATKIPMHKVMAGATGKTGKK